VSTQSDDETNDKPDTPAAPVDHGKSTDHQNNSEQEQKAPSQISVWIKARGWDWSLIFSGLVAVFTIVTAQATCRQAGLTREAIDDARKAAAEDGNFRLKEIEAERERFGRTVKNAEDSLAASIEANRGVLSRMDSAVKLNAESNALTRKSNTLTEEGLDMEHRAERPWLSVQQWSSDHSIELDPNDLASPEIEVAVDNVGRTPAFRVIFLSDMEAMSIPSTTDRPPTVDPNITTSGTIHWMLPYKTVRYPSQARKFPGQIPILAPGGTLRIPCKVRGNFMMQLEEIKRGNSNIVCHGWIAYLDGIQLEHTTHFCLELSGEHDMEVGRSATGAFTGLIVRDRWVSHPCPEYNNTGPRLNDAN